MMDKLITQELLFGNVIYPTQEEEEEFNSFLVLIMGMYLSGKSYRYVHAKISKSNISSGFKKSFIRFMDLQGKIILNKVPPKLDASREFLGGKSLTDIIDKLEESIRTRIFRAASDIKNLSEADRINGYKSIIKRETKRFRRYNEQLWETLSKSAREQYREVEESEPKERDNIKGWISIAVLDNRTSVICASFHDRVYLKPDYKSRSDIPNLPPRHPNCRSIVVPMHNDFSVSSYKSQTIDTFFSRNPDLAKGFMGKRKYELWKNSGKKLRSYFDVKNNRFYTNDEIIELSKKGNN